MTATDAAIEIGYRVAQRDEQMLVQRIEELLGRVPTNAEVARHGHKTIDSIGTVKWYWDSMLLFVRRNDNFTFHWTAT